LTPGDPSMMVQPGAGRMVRDGPLDETTETGGRPVRDDLLIDVASGEVVPSQPAGSPSSDGIMTVDQLLRLAADRRASSRSRLAAVMRDLIDGRRGNLSDREWGWMTDILHTLIGGIEKPVRRKLAKTLGRLQVVPRSLITRLANDDIDIAYPVLVNSQLLADEDLIEIFVEEGNDLLDKADTLVARLREAPGENEAVAGLQRQLHTIKGNARAGGLGGIGDLSHVMESMLEAAVADRLALGRPAVELLERGTQRARQDRRRRRREHEVLARRGGHGGGDPGPRADTARDPAHAERSAELVEARIGAHQEHP
jgi:HPt (histidine-containing phosphotransfer) domain-containing protein